MNKTMQLIFDDCTVLLSRQIAAIGCNYDSMSVFLVCAAACCTNSLLTAGESHRQTVKGGGNRCWMKREMTI